MGKIKNWDKLDDTNLVAEWENAVTGERIAVVDTSDYSDHSYAVSHSELKFYRRNAEMPETTMANKDYKKDAMELARNKMKTFTREDEEGRDLEREEKDFVFRTFAKYWDFKSQDIHNMIAWYISQNYHVDVEFTNPDGSIEHREVKIGTTQHDHHVIGSVEGVRDTVGKENFELYGWANEKEDVLDQILKERNLYTREMLTACLKEDIGYDSDRFHEETSEIDEELRDRLAERIGEVYKSRTEENLFYREK